MTNPYNVLGVSQNASDEEVKTAYRELAKRYSSDDGYSTDPLQNVADARMQELNEAYDQIMAVRRTGGNTADGAQAQASGQAQGYQQNAYQSQNSGGARYTDIRQLIRSGDILSAEQRLTSIDASQRGAEWNFLMGSVCQSKGWLDEAYRYFGTACSQDPSNAEYAAAYNRMHQERSTGGTSYNPYAGKQNRTNPGGCMNDDACSSACQCMCLYQLCSSCCCGGR